jgi:hypothetical protein
MTFIGLEETQIVAQHNPPRLAGKLNTPKEQTTGSGNHDMESLD